MAIALETSTISYAGNGSTSAGYPVPFPVVNAGHIAVSVLAPGGTTPVELTAGQYTVHDLGSGTYNVTTSTAVANTHVVTVYRRMPLDQPFEFPEGAILRTREIERSQDRIVMQIQGQNRRIDNTLQLRTSSAQTGNAILPLVREGVVGFDGDLDPQILTYDELAVEMQSRLVTVPPGSGTVSALSSRAAIWLWRLRASRRRVCSLLMSTS